jgi:hypothetical protein
MIMLEQERGKELSSTHMAADEGERGGDEQSNNLPAKSTGLAHEPEPGGPTTPRRAAGQRASHLNFP